MPMRQCLKIGQIQLALAIKARENAGMDAAINNAGTKSNTHLNAHSEFFDFMPFPKRATSGGFQWRWGKKVKPQDETI